MQVSEPTHGKGTPVTEDRMAVLERLRKGTEDGDDFLREGLRTFLHELIEAEVTAVIGAERHERTEERTTQRNGYRSRLFDTRLGTIAVAIPKLRSGSSFPSWLEPRRRSAPALVAGVAEAYVQGVSTRRVEALVQQLGIAGLSKSEVSRMAQRLDEQGRVFRERRLDAAYPWLWRDARYEHVREGGRVQSMAVVVAYGVRADGVRAVLGVDVGLSEDVALWRTFLQGLVGRGLSGVRLVISDAHTGLKQAVREVFVGASWQRRVPTRRVAWGPAAGSSSCAPCWRGCRRRPWRWWGPRCARSSRRPTVRPRKPNSTMSVKYCRRSSPRW
jgi:putative transposase